MDPENSQQLHDYNPGISDTGVFWTTAIPKSALEVHLGAGQAVMQVQDFPMPDAFTFPNSVLETIPFEDAVVSFRVQWDIDGPYQTVDSSDEQRRFKFKESTDPSAASIEWSSQNAGGFAFQSDPAETSINEYANLGRERNGAFY